MKWNDTPTYFKIQSAGLRCCLCVIGAAIASLEVRDVSGEYVNVALSPINLLNDSDDPSLAGRTVGPCCGRVRAGRIEINGHEFQLECNEGENHLHGGSTGCAHRAWEGEQFSEKHVRFRLELPDGLAGYPGNRSLTADYEVFDDALQVTYAAQTDRPTWLDMTNHIYFDLSGRFDGAALRQTLQAAAARVVRNEPNHLPQTVAPAEGAFNFLTPCVLADKLRDYPEESQLAIGRGYNNALLLDETLRRELGFCARLISPESGICMTLDTDAPAIVLYTGGFLDSRTRLAGGSAIPGCAVAMEAQDVPDPFHLPGCSPNILRPGEVWRRRISWRFDRRTVC